MNLQVSNSKFYLIFIKIKEIRISVKILELVTRSVTSFCVTQFRKSISLLENCKPQQNLDFEITSDFFIKWNKIQFKIIFKKWRFGILELRNRITKPSYAKWRHTSSYWLKIFSRNSSFKLLTCLHKMLNWTSSY